MHDRLGTWQPRLAAALALGALLVLSPARAQAQTGASFEYHLSSEAYTLIAVGCVATGASLGFLVADLIVASHHGWLPPLAAALELVSAGLPWLVIAGVLASNGDDGGASAALVMLGLGFSAHAVASFALYDPSPHAAPPDHAQSVPRTVHVAPWLAPRQAGASVFARF